MAEEPRDELLHDVSSLLRLHRGPCPASETLIAYARGELAPPEASAAGAHLRLCPSCQELAALGGDVAEEGAEEWAEEGEVDEVTWKRAARGLDARAAPWREAEPASGPASGPTSRPGWRAAALVAAALVVAVGTGLWIEGDREAPGGRSTTTRGLALRPIEPVGAVETLAAFRWQAPPVDLEFIVHLESGGEPVWSGTSGSTELEAPPELLALLEPGRSYAWRVEARDESGQVVLESGWAAVTLRPGGR